MTLAGSVLTFVSVFVAALLAFYLDGLRESRATRRWVAEYLGFWRDMLRASASERETNDVGLRRIETALDTWLSGSAPIWEDVDSINVNSVVEFTRPLLSVGGSVVPQDLMRQLFTADALAPAMKLRSTSVARLYEARVLPLRLAQTVPLGEVDHRAVEFYRAEFLGLCAQLREYSDGLAEICADLERAGF
jgi:hypothetical protein